MALPNAVLAHEFASTDDMFKWIFSLMGSEIEYEDPDDIKAVVVNILSISHAFFPLGTTDSPGALLCTVVLAVEEADVEAALLPDWEGGSVDGNNN